MSAGCITPALSLITPHASQLVAESGVAPDDLLVMSQPSLVPAPSPHQEHAVRFELTISGFADRRLNQLGYACHKSLELRAGIEPPLSPWQGDVIPLDQRSPEDFESRILNFEFELRFAIRNWTFEILWCWRKESNLHQTGFEPVASAGWATPARPGKCWVLSWDRPHSELSTLLSALHRVPSGRFELTTVQFLRLATPTSWSTRA